MDTANKIKRAEEAFDNGNGLLVFLKKGEQEYRIKNVFGNGGIQRDTEDRARNFGID